MTLAYHFSVDDVLAGLVRDDHPLLDTLAALHDRHGARVDIYSFHRAAADGAATTLDEIPAVVARRLEACDWLRIGPHGEDYGTPPHLQSVAEQRAMLARVYGAFDRVAPGARRARWVRLHYFSECFELAPELRERGVEALLTTDKATGCYRLPQACRDALLRDGRTDHAGLAFVRSHLRLEDLAREAPPPGEVEQRLDAILAAHGCAVIFTHEIDLADETTRAMAGRCLAHLRRAGAHPV